MDKVKHVFREHVQPKLRKVEAYLNNDKNPDKLVKTVALVEKKTGIKRMHLFYGVLVLALFLVLIENAFKIVALLVGTVYPAYKSFKAIESKEKDDDTQWLVYWVVFAAFSVVELFTDALVSWLPLYYLLKLMVLFACMYPDRKRNLSHVLYYRLIRPYLLEKQPAVDSTMKASADAFRRAADVVDPSNKTE